MVNANMKIEKLNIVDAVVDLTVSFTTDTVAKSPRIAIVFESDDGDFRRVPMLTVKDGNTATASGVYDTSAVFYKKVTDIVRVSFVFSDGIDLGDRYDSDIVVENKKKKSANHFFSLSNREKVKALVGFALNVCSLPFRLLPIKQNRVSFFTNRTKQPTGNLRAVYGAVQQMDDVDVRLCCHYGGAVSSLKMLFQFLHLYMTSKVVYIDDYLHPISYITKRKGVSLVQLWHGCGAFKTFGFSRIHKESVLELYSPNHRQYDVAVVSSPDVIDFYAEAFGINKTKVLPLGAPRCDALADEGYKSNFRQEFFSQNPQLAGKKLLLFAPTFRGGGNGDCFYPMEQFDVDKVLDALGDEWAILIKLHPYLTEKFTCSKRNADRMLDCSGSDVNDILIVSDFLVTDYSSVIFEASILGVPMAFLTYDLEEFIASRDFYGDFESFIPGPIARNVDELIDLINQNGDLAAVEEFRKRAFGDSIGNACDNLVDLTNQLFGRK